jgi:hypothetical protein
MSDQDHFNQSAALGIIQEMVQQSRYRLSKSAVFFVIWGCAITTACLLHYLFIQLQVAEGVYVWPLFIGLGVAGTAIAGWKQKADEQQQARSYIDRISTYLWAGSSVPFAILLGWAALVTGGLLRFKPLVAGGVLSWGISGLTLFLSGPEILLLMAAALLVGYLIPAWMMIRADRVADEVTRS